jgi:hypothetical protein
VNAPTLSRARPSVRLASASMKMRLAEEENSDAPLVIASL